MKKKAKRSKRGPKKGNGSFDFTDIIHLALQKRNQISKEVRYYADGIVHTLTHADFLPNKNKLIREARHNLERFVKKIQKSDVASRAIDMAADKGGEFLSLLNFPTKKDVARLNSRLNHLEKRLKTLHG